MRKQKFMIPPSKSARTYNIPKKRESKNNITISFTMVYFLSISVTGSEIASSKTDNTVRLHERNHHTYYRPKGNSECAVHPLLSGQSSN